MATLAETGSSKPNENNPYNQALANANAQDTPASRAKSIGSSVAGVGKDVYNSAVTGANDLYQGALSGASDIGSSLSGLNSSLWNHLFGASTPDSSSSTPRTPSTPGGSPLVGSGLVKTLGDIPSTADDSVASTPEAASAADSKAQKQAQALKAVNHAISPSTAKAPKAPTAQQDVNAAMAPDQAILAGLPAEYQSTMAELAPYLNTGSSGNAALDAANATVDQVAGNSDNAVLSALKQLPKDSKEYAKSVTTQPIIQALLGFGKYEETYAGAQPSGQSNWSAQMDDIYKYLSGSNASSDGLGSPQSAAAGANNSQVAASTDAGGGNG